MKAYFENMNEAYRKKHYPQGSVFAAVSNSAKKGGITVYIFFGLILLGSLAGLVWAANTTISYRQAGESDMVQAGIGICIFFAVFILISVLCITISIVRGKRGSAGWIKKSAENSRLEESQIREFESQAMESGSYILKMVSSINAVMSGSKDGILTASYVYLADSNQTVLPVQNIAIACLVDQVYHVGKQHTAVNYLQISLLGFNGVHAWAETSAEAGRALMAILTDQNPKINTFDGKILTEREFADCKKMI